LDQASQISLAMPESRCDGLGPGNVKSREQVLVAAFPEETPEVHVASLSPNQGVLKLQEAVVSSSGDVSLKATRTVSLKEIEALQCKDTQIALLGRDRRLLVQLHFESPTDVQGWAEDLRSLTGSGRGDADSRQPKGENQPSPAATTEEEAEDINMLQARSRQLQNRIGTLEAISKRRDKHLHKMLRRLDGAMQMLGAVQDMCGQQKKVIEAQQVAILELKKESGDAGDSAEVSYGDAPGNHAHSAGIANGSSAGGAADGTRGSPQGPGDREEYESSEQQLSAAEAEIAAKTQQMLALLQQADDMQRAMHQLEALDPSSLNGMCGAGTAAAPDLAQQQAEADADDEEVDDQEALAEIKNLEAEKQRYETMFRNQQQEHQDLVQKLSRMRSLMTMLGMQEGDLDESGSEGGGGDGASAAQT